MCVKRSCFCKRLSLSGVPGMPTCIYFCDSFMWSIWLSEVRWHINCIDAWPRLMSPSTIQTLYYQGLPLETFRGVCHTAWFSGSTVIIIDHKTCTSPQYLFRTVDIFRPLLWGSMKCLREPPPKLILSRPCVGLRSNSLGFVVLVALKPKIYFPY